MDRIRGHWMTEHDHARYGDRIAEHYDEWYSSFDTEGAVALLVELAGPGPVLELGVGTGRIALPLAERGLEVHGIDASPAMIAKLRAKPGGERIHVITGDLADVATDTSYSLVVVVFSTLFALLTQQDQVRCFRNVAAHLSPSGAFVVEAFVPDLARFDRGQRVGVERLDDNGVVLEASLHDPVHQRVDSRHLRLSQDGIDAIPVSLRYAWPSELDLMAELAGLRLQDRWCDWHRGAFTAASPCHVSVYGRSAPS
jgi:SAM-dependent methyltransferase